jgi:DNA primase
VAFDRLRGLVPLPAVLARYGLLSTLKRSGSQLKGCCPLHDGTSRRQFVVNVETNTWYCFGSCRRGGGTLEFVAAMERVSLVRAAELIAQWFALASHQPRTQQHRRRPMSTRPTHKVLAVTERGVGDATKTYYTKIGVAFPIKGGAGLSLQMDALPLNGRLIVLEITDDETPDEAPPRTAAEER